MLRLVQPWPDPFTINARSPYGPRVHPITGKRTFHHGIDVAMPVGTPLRAGADGVVAHKGQGGSGGITLLLKHANNMHTVYYHLQKPSALPVGAQVKAGDIVAYSGNTGASTGPHLHYELRRSRTWGDTIDPAPHIVRNQPAPKPPVGLPQPIKNRPVLDAQFARLKNRFRGLKGGTHF
jgi:murein DD-endopeptidase MepM/ murein hydrolase activator NlpD